MSSQQTKRKRKNDDSDLPRRVRTCSSDFGFNILWLSSKSLQRIFSYASLADLVVLKKTCRKFSQVVHIVFTEKYWPLHEGSSYTFPKNNLSCDETALLIENFGEKFRKVLLKFAGQETKQQMRNYFSLLEYCSSMRSLTIENVDFNRLTIGQLRCKSFANLTSLSLIECSGAEANYQVILNACDPLKLEYIALGKNLSDDILAFVGARMRSLKNFDVHLEDETPAFTANLSKLQSLRVLRNVSIHIPFDEVPIASVINSLARIDSLGKLFLYCNKTSQDNDFAKSINRINHLMCIVAETKSEMPNFKTITNFKNKEHSYSKERNKHCYKFTQL